MSGSFVKEECTYNFFVDRFAEGIQGMGSRSLKLTSRVSIQEGLFDITQKCKGLLSLILFVRHTEHD